MIWGKVRNLITFGGRALNSVKKGKKFYVLKVNQVIDLFLYRVWKARKGVISYRRKVKTTILVRTHQLEEENFFTLRIKLISPTKIKTA